MDSAQQEEMNPPDGAAGQSSQAPPETHDRLLQFRDACEKVSSGEWTDDAFTTFLDQVAEMVAQREAQARDLEIPAEAFEEFRLEIEAGFAGIERFSTGITTLRAYLIDRDPSHLDEGLEIIREGSDALNRAVQLNYENRRALETLLANQSATL